MSLMKVTFKVKKIIFRDADSRYSIIKAEILSKLEENFSQEMSVKGFFSTLYVGDEYECLVIPKLDDNYGYYLEMTDIPELKVPENKKALAEFISKRVNKLSTKKALEIIEELGLDTLSKIKKDYKILLNVKGIKEKKALSIYQQLIEHQSYEDLAVFIQGIGIEVHIANKIYDKFRENSLSRIKTNPYCVCYDNEIEFKYADKIAIKLDIPMNNCFRIETAILDYLTYRTTTYGDLCIYKDILLSELNNYLNKFSSYKDNNITEEEINKCIDTLIEIGKVTIEKDKEGYIYIYKSIYSYIENKIIDNLNKILTEDKIPFCQKSDIDDFIEYYESNYFKLDVNQKEAIYNSITNGMSILTGGPGTGKTMTTNAIVQCIKKINPETTILLLAPTGKASDRLTELTNMPSSTIHRSLKINPFVKNTELEEITEDFVFIDESSMIDAYIFERLTAVISENTSVITVGDVDQLPSVGPGLILRDMIDSGKIVTTKLNKIFRQAENSNIVLNAHRVIKGKDSKTVNGIDISNKNNSNFIFWKENNINIIKEKLFKSLDKLFNHYKYKVNDICILTPLKVGDLGSIELNRLLQKKLNPPSPLKAEYEIDSINTFRVGDRVMQNKNNYEFNVFNGFVGNITNIYTIINNKGVMETQIEVNYPKKEDIVVYGEKELSELELAFAMTIHKSQGSEFPVVIIPIHDIQKIMLNRNLIYTAITRAKEKLIMIGEEDALNYSINHLTTFNRISRLKEKIQNLRL